MMTGRDLARRIKQVLIDAGIDPCRPETWTGKPYASDLVIIYGMALNLSGWDYCDECGNEHPDAELYRPEPGADSCLCRWCYPDSGETGWALGIGGIGDSHAAR